MLFFVSTGVGATKLKCFLQNNGTDNKQTNNTILKMSAKNEYGWFYDLECPPDQAAVEYHRVKNCVFATRYAYRVRYNRVLVPPLKQPNDEFLIDECIVPTSESPYIIEIPEPGPETKRQPFIIQNRGGMKKPEEEETWNSKAKIFGSVVAGLVCYGVMTA